MVTPIVGALCDRLRVLRVTTAAEMAEALAVRRRVFIEEQRVPEHEEIDAHDADPAMVADCLHVLARRDGAVASAGP